MGGSTIFNISWSGIFEMRRPTNDERGRFAEHFTVEGWTRRGDAHMCRVARPSLDHSQTHQPRTYIFVAARLVRETRLLRCVNPVR